MKTSCTVSMVICFAVICTNLFADPVYTLSTLSGRYMFFDDYSSPNWTHVGTTTLNGSRAGTNHVHSSGWSFSNCRMGRFASGTNTNIPPLLNNNVYVPNTNYCAYFQNSLAAVMESPVFTNGIGTLYFDILSVNMPMTVPEIRVYVTTNTGWEEVDSLTLTNGVLMRYKRTFNNAQPMAIKFVRTNVNGGISKEEFFVAIDNIRVSEPPANVVMDKGLTPFKTYPSINSSMDLQIRIDNVLGLYKTTSATRTNVLFVSRWNYLGQKTTPWVTNKMHYVSGTGDGLGNGELWQPQNAMSVFPDAGDLEYYFLCYFNGMYYQSYDYSAYPQVLNPALFPPENNSPCLYSADGVTTFSGGIPSNPFKFQLRLFPSGHDTVTVKLYLNGTTPISLPMTLCGTNKWQAKFDIVNHPDTTNLLWHFEATGAYTNAFTTTTDKTYWQNASPQNGILPQRGTCTITDASITNHPRDWFSVAVTPSESGYVFFTLDTAQNESRAERGEYQNFNTWDTGMNAQNYFSDADDKYPKTSYSQNFSNDWQQSYFTGLSNWFGTVSFAGQTAAIRVDPQQVLDQPGYWKAGSFQYVAERTAINGLAPDAQTAGQRRNQGIRLLGGNFGYDYGYFQGSSGQQNVFNGMGTITYKARLSRPIATDKDYNKHIAYRFSEFFRTNYVITSSIRAVSAADMSPENPSVSLIAYYQHSEKFYEYRMTQVADSRAINGTGINIDGSTGAPRDKRIRHEIWKWNGATPVRLAYSERVVVTWPDTVYDGWLYAAPSTGAKTSFRIFNNAGSVSLAVSYNLQAIAFTAENGAIIVNGAVVDSLSPIRSGAYGFHSADCAVFVPDMQIGVSTFDAADSGAPKTDVIGATSFPNSDEWSWRAELYLLSGNQFISTPQSTTVKVMTGTSELGPWTTFKTNVVSSYSYQTFTESPKNWNSLCAKIQANDAIGVVIDGVRVESWRGENITSFPSDNWSITNGWLSYTAPDWYAHLDASQADPTKIQGVRSPRIQGIGSLTFNCRVAAVPAEIKLQYTLNDPPSAYGWIDITNLLFSATTGWTNANYYLALAPATNLYVRILNVATNRQAIVDLKDIVIWNNPANSPYDWAAYNMKITNTETNKWWLDKERSGYMNSGVASNTIPTRPMTQFNPYIMAPRLTRGLGTISFLARAFTTNYIAGNTNTSISVYATTGAWDKNRPDTPGAGWIKLYTFTNITNAFYRPFSYSHPVLPNNIKAVKLVVEGVVPLGTAPQRVCVDEIAVTEAFYPSFDITGVKLFREGSELTQQPLEGESIAIEAQLTCIKNDPQAINLFVTYVLGTATWGVTNAPTEQRITLPMTLINPENRIYRTSASIPSQNKDTVVQYCVWAEYGDNGSLHVYQSPDTMDHFIEPPWYANDLNQLYAPRWSPYYIVAGTNTLSSLVPAVQNIPYTGGVFSVFVGARANWTAQCNTPWALPLETTGSFATNMQYRVIPNAGKAGRSANLTFTCGLGADTLLINQDQAPSNFDAALGSTGLEWTMGGDMLWFEQAQNVKEGASALQSGPITNNLQSWIETSVVGPGTLSFWWSVSSEGGYDTLTCSIDASPQKIISGNKSGWMQEQFMIGVGTHTVRWTYTKDESNSEGQDCGWLDALQWAPAPLLTGFALWANDVGLIGTQADLFLQDRNHDGIANGFEYAFGTNLSLSSLLLNIRFINGKAIVEIPKQDESTLPSVNVHVRGSTNLLDWTLPMIPAIDTTGKPAHRSWHEPDGAPPAKAFFKLEAELK